MMQLTRAMANLHITDTPRYRRCVCPQVCMNVCMCIWWEPLPYGYVNDYHNDYRNQHMHAHVWELGEVLRGLAWMSISGYVPRPPPLSAWYVFTDSSNPSLATPPHEPFPNLDFLEPVLTPAWLGWGLEDEADVMALHHFIYPERIWCPPSPASHEPFRNPHTPPVWRTHKWVTPRAKVRAHSAYVLTICQREPQPEHAPTPTPPNTTSIHREGCNIWYRSHNCTHTVET